MRIAADNRSALKPASTSHSAPRALPTLAKIASAAGVSKSTVSRALRSHSKLAPETTKRIRRLAEKFGYNRSPLVGEVMRRMRGRGHFAALGRIAYLTFDTTVQGWRDQITFLRFFEGARSRATQLGLQVDPFWMSEPGLTAQRAASILRARGIEAVLIGPTTGWARTPELDLANLCAVKIGTPFPDLPLPCAGHHHFRGITVALRELARRAYHRPGLVLRRYLEAKTDGTWTAALLHHQQGLAARDRIPPLLVDDATPDAFAAWFRRWKPDVILGVGPHLTAWMASLKLRIPRDVGFVDLDRCSDDRAGIDQHSDAIGGAAVDLLLSRLLAHERGPSLTAPLVLIDGSWADGPTVRAS